MKALSVPFKISNGSVSTTTNYDVVVRGQVIDAAATNEGERLMNPTWGCNLRQRVFDPSDALVRSEVTGQIQTVLPNLVPRALITNVNLVSTNSEPNLVRINISYRASSYSPEVNLSIPLAADDPSESSQI